MNEPSNVPPEHQNPDESPRVGADVTHSAEQQMTAHSSATSEPNPQQPSVDNLPNEQAQIGNVAEHSNSTHSESSDLTGTNAASRPSQGGHVNQFFGAELVERPKISPEPNTTSATTTTRTTTNTTGTTTPNPSETRATFSLDQALKLGWEKTWQYFWPYVGITTSTFLLASFPTIMTSVVMFINSSPAMIALGLIASGIGVVLQEAVAMGMLNLQLRVLDGQTIETKDVFAPFNRVFKFIGAAILYKVMVFFGTLCFVVPGIILHVKFQFFGYFIVERNLGPLQALKASSKLTENCKMDLFFFSVVQWFVSSAGTMFFLVGGFPAWIINSIATADVYRQLIRNMPDHPLLGQAQPPALADSIPTLPLPPEIAESA